MNPYQRDVNGYIGIRDANTFDYRGSINPGGNYAWQGRQPMLYRRWYPTVTTLANGSALAISGQRYGGPIGTPNGVQALIPEVYNIIPANSSANPWQPLTGASRYIPSYPWMFLAPDGRVFNAGPNPDAMFLDPTATTAGSSNVGAWGSSTYRSVLNLEREYGSAVMYAPGKILILGGSTSAGVTNTTELIDLNTLASAQFRKAAPMQFARTNVNATILADGTVLATGGESYRSVIEADAVMPAELWTPPSGKFPGGQWRTLNAMATPRLYHSTAVLLPDATVLSTGGGEGSNYPAHPDYEIFTPPYLCKGLGRPEIASAPQAVAYGQAFAVTSRHAGTLQASATQGTGRVTLVRLSSVTHCFNMNQRFLTLTPTSISNDQINLTAPSDPNLCPPGHYMLFLIDGNGTPSQASIIAINAAACANILTLSTPTVVNSNGCDQTVRFAANGGGPGNYTWTVNGLPAGAGPASFIDFSVNAYSPTLQVQVEQSAGCGASSTTTIYFPQCVYASRAAPGKP